MADMMDLLPMTLLLVSVCVPTAFAVTYVWQTTD